MGNLARTVEAPASLGCLSCIESRCCTYLYFASKAYRLPSLPMLFNDMHDCTTHSHYPTAIQL